MVSSVLAQESPSGGMVNPIAEERSDEPIVLTNPNNNIRTHQAATITLHLHQPLIVQFNNSKIYCGVWPCGYPIYNPPRVNVGIDPVTTWSLQSSSNEAVLFNEVDQQQSSEGKNSWVFEAASVGTTVLHFRYNGHFVNRNGYFYPENGCSWSGSIDITVNVVRVTE